MTTYSAADVERLVGLSAATLRALVKGGFVAPVREKRELRFSFQDLTIARTAQALVVAGVSKQRLQGALRRVLERPESGQYALGFGDGAKRALKPAPQPARPPEEDLFERALALEDEDAEAAIDAYRQLIAAEPARTDARVNLGRLLHERGDAAAAVTVYRGSLAAGGDDAVLQFNLAVALEDSGRPQDAIAAYRAALAHDPDMADAHCNLALLCESLGRKQDAIRHLAQYRKLTGSRAG